MAASTRDLLLNSVTGTVGDLDGTPPGDNYADSVEVMIVYPDGAGSTTSLIGYPDPGGYFSFDSLPIGNHRLLLSPHHQRNDHIAIGRHRVIGLQNTPRVFDHAAVTYERGHRLSP